MPAKWLDAINPTQREAVTYGDGPLLVVAGAGTGKTKTLACRVAWLMQRGVSPERILLLTFTRRAAAEMLERAGQLIGRRRGAGAGPVWGGTFHAVANRLLRIYGRAIGLPADFTVMDPGDVADLMHLIRNELGLAKSKRRFPQKQTLVGVYSRMVNAQEKLGDTLQKYFPWCQDDRENIRRIFEVYTERKRARHLVDYDDLLLLWTALTESREVAAVVADRFEHVLVDEYQDTNPIQAELLRGMRRRVPNVMAVGDDAQSIYSFRAATVRNILDFPKHFPGTHIVTLERNYRSTQPILAASNAVMAQARERYTKELWSERSSGPKPVLLTCLDEDNQCNTVCDNILAHLEQGIPLRRQAVLFRAGHHSDRLEIELARRNIPFHKYGGLKFIEAAHIKDLLAFLRILENPFDEMSWFRVLQLLPGIGPRTARRVMEALGVGGGGGGGGDGGGGGTVKLRPGAAGAEPGRGTARPSPDHGQEITLADRSLPVPAIDHGQGMVLPDRSLSVPPGLVTPLRRLLDDPPVVPAAASEAFTELRSALADCLRLAPQATDAPDEPREGPTVASQIERLRRFYEPIFHEFYENAVIRVRDLEQLEQIAAGYRSRQRFVTDLTLDPPQATSDLAQPPFLEEDYLILSTIHSAKGCEWDVVHIIHAADGMIPSDMAVTDEAGVEEERRLLYVAMTRARNALYVYFPLRYYHRRFGRSDAHGYAQLSRYLSGEVRSFFECRSAYMDLDEDAPAASAGAAVDLSSRLRRLWSD